MTYTDEQIAEAMERSDSYHGQAGTGLQEAVIVLASALRAAQERIKELENKTVPMEMLAEEVHKDYCRDYEMRNGKPYWTGGDYSKLDEATKDIDRVTVRAVLDAIGYTVTVNGKE